MPLLRLSFPFLIAILLLADRCLLSHALDTIGSMDKYGLRREELSSDLLATVTQGVARNDPESLYFYALYHYYGMSVEVNKVKAFQYFKKSADLHHPFAQLVLGIMLVNGEVQLNPPAGFHYLQESFEKGGNWDAAVWLGQCYLNGKGVEKDQAKAFDLFEKAALQADKVEAHHMLGILYEYGVGVDEDFTLALHHYRIASDNHHVESRYHLALMLAYGRGTRQDFGRALALFHQGFQQDHRPSVYYLGVMTLNGHGTEVDYPLALKYFEICSSEDSVAWVRENCEKAREELRRSLKEANERNRQMAAAIGAEEVAGLDLAFEQEL